MITFAISAVLLLPALAAPEIESQPASVPPAKPKVVCRNEVPTGSVLAKKVCLSEKQAAAREQGARKDREKLRDMRNNRPSISQF